MGPFLTGGAGISFTDFFSSFFAFFSFFALLFGGGVGSAKSSEEIKTNSFQDFIVRVYSGELRQKGMKISFQYKVVFSNLCTNFYTSVL